MKGHVTLKVVYLLQPVQEFNLHNQAKTIVLTKTKKNLAWQP
jgi:hypothetical protein